MTDEPKDPAMVGRPPSASQVPFDAGLHARDFAQRYAEPIESMIRRRMRSLGIPEKSVGHPDIMHGIEDAAFHSRYRDAGGVSPDGRIIIGSGVFNPERMDATGPNASLAWSKARLSDRLNAAIAHEYEEGKSQSHQEAVEDAPESELPIGGRTRKLLRTIRLDEQSTRRGDSSHSR
jgi:hypothetical protein